MTVVDDRQVAEWGAVSGRLVGAPRRGRRVGGPVRPGPSRPPGSAFGYRGTGVAMSQGRHTRRTVSASASIGVAALAALITLWLGALANFSGQRAGTPAHLPDRLAVVQVQAGETLQHLAGRVAPDAPAGRVVERIRELNKLESAAVEAGQTLIAPVG